MPAQTNSAGTSRSSRSPTAAAEPSLKRRRAAKACQNCRLQKAKCDGKPPICNRCAGYGHTCTWSEQKRDPPRRSDGSILENIISDGPQSPRSENSTPLYLAIQSYEKLMRSVRLDLSDSTRAAVDLTLSYIRCQLPPGVLDPDASSSVRAPPMTGESCYQSGSASQSANGQRYLGEASDLYYFHTIKNILQDQGQPGGEAENDIQSYDQGIQHVETPDGVDCADLLTKELADNFIMIYFSTIHIAYPFLSKPLFIEKYESFWKRDKEFTESSSWLSLMYTMFAIGAYYTSFPLSETAERQACLRCCSHNTSFYLQQETMRRTWYLMYVLDRLLALQLGRPVAIHKQEYRVNLPLETDETACLFDGDSFPFRPDKSPSTLDYFVSVTKFSQILGQVISDLYSPSQAVLDPDRMLLSTTTLDEQLLEWKTRLPRHLRFDLGHTFEKSIVFKRQQMISCLLCASSVLLVSRACIDPTQATAEVYSQALDEDAETCLKVFDALRMPSMENAVNNTLDGPFSFGETQSVLEWQIWPGELSDPMAWSAQFINPSQSSQFGGNPVSGPQIPFYAQIKESN
ncbi:Transcriptional activator acu-15 [Hyphodiscus hymeniophilus]|uniref:Transcriptional activator acu-15 n=1 Tax=Hyphodiscus hymeniophilus TaxID=353542 RepID=A0A9P7AVQ6_9HELO|nr:Transcriptional activator acu-15 [Hyphodiscus hymeniophilus]